MNSITNGSHGRANRFPSTYFEYSCSVPLVYWQVAALLRDKDLPNRMHKTQVLNVVWFTGSLCAYWAHLSILCRLYTTARHRALQDVRPHAALIGGAEWSISYRYTVKIKPQLLWSLHSAVNHSSQVWGKLASVAHRRSLRMWKQIGCIQNANANVLRCQCVLINKVSKGGGMWEKRLWIMRQHDLILLTFSLLERKTSFKNAKAFIQLLNENTEYLPM